MHSVLRQKGYGRSSRIVRLFVCVYVIASKADIANLSVHVCAECGVIFQCYVDRCL